MRVRSSAGATQREQPRYETRISPAMSAQGHLRKWRPTIVMSASPSILLQKSFGGDERNFLGPLIRFVRRDVRDLIAYQKNGHGASYRRHRVLRRRSCLKFDFREIFGVVRFSTFATESPQQQTFVRAVTSASCQTRKSRRVTRSCFRDNDLLSEGASCRFHL